MNIFNKKTSGVMEVDTISKNTSSTKNQMRRGNFIKMIIFCALFVLTSLTSIMAQTGPSITIVNNTGYTIYYVYISTTTDSNWGSDVLPSDQLINNGESVTIRLPYALNVVNRYDIRLEDSDGDTYSKYDVLVSANARIVFTISDIDNKSTPPSSSNPFITIVNNTGYTIYLVYLKSTTSSNWGSDRLGSSEIIFNGSSATVQLPHPLNVVNRYDVRIVDSDDDTYTIYNVLVSAGSRIVFSISDIDMY